MDRGIEFLKQQVNSAVAQHETFVRALHDHERQADDPRYQDLCGKHLPAMREHQRLLEDYQESLGADPGPMKRPASAAKPSGSALADAVRDGDYLRLVGDLVLARQAGDTFRVFREGGRALGDIQLSRIGEIGEQYHEEYVREANRLVQLMFVEQVRSGQDDALPSSGDGRSRRRERVVERSPAREVPE